MQCIITENILTNLIYYVETENGLTTHRESVLQLKKPPVESRKVQPTKTRIKHQPTNESFILTLLLSLSRAIK